MTINLEQIKKRLEAKRAELQENIKGLTEAHPRPVGAIEANEGPQDFEDIAVDFLETQQEQYLMVIEQGTDGKCVDCGQPIPERRLEAIPWAARDVKCEEKLEQRNLSVTETYNA